MKTDREMTEAILAEVQRRSKRKKRRISAAAAVVVVVLAVTAAVAARQAFLPREPSNSTTEAIGQPETSELTVPAQNEITTAATTTANGARQTTDGVIIQTTADLTTSSTAQQQIPGTTQGPSAPDKSSGDEYGGSVGGVRIPALPIDRTIRYTGEAITDAEATAYFKENAWLQSALASSGVDASGIRFAEHGYCHVSYDGSEGKSFEVRRNFRDYLVWNSDDLLIAIVTLTKENGSLSATPAFGGPWFGDYNAFLQQHRGEALVYVYAGWMELVITPDNKVVNPQGTDVSRYLAGVENPYEIFKCDAAAYTP